jgi:hypothetical protein
VTASSNAPKKTAAPSTPKRIQPVDGRTFTTCMEQLQNGYVTSVAATAGCTVEPINRDVHGVDMLIIRPSEVGVQEVSLYVQLKSTTTIKPDPAAESFSFQFKHRDHMLRLTTPRKHPKALLLVMVCPPEQAAWSVAAHNELAVRHCCYWAHLEGETVGDTVQSPSVRVPIKNVFDAHALRRIMEKLDREEPLK